MHNIFLCRVYIVFTHKYMFQRYLYKSMVKNPIKIVSNILQNIAFFISSKIFKHEIILSVVGQLATLKKSHSKHLSVNIRSSGLLHTYISYLWHDDNDNHNICISNVQPACEKLNVCWFNDIIQRPINIIAIYIYRIDTFINILIRNW